MKLVIRSRQSGKTLEAIKGSHETGAYIVCPTYQECNRVARVARQLGYDIPFPLTAAEFTTGAYCSKGISSIIVDNLDWLIQAISRVPVIMATVTDESIGGNRE